MDHLNHFEIIDAPSPPKFEYQIIGAIEDRVFLQNDGRIFYKNHGTHVIDHELRTMEFLPCPDRFEKLKSSTEGGNVVGKIGSVTY